MSQGDYEPPRRRKDPSLGCTILLGGIAIIVVLGFIAWLLTRY